MATIKQDNRCSPGPGDRCETRQQRGLTNAGDTVNV